MKKLAPCSSCQCVRVVVARELCTTCYNKFNRLGLLDKYFPAKAVGRPRKQAA